uniref:Uncharacterized protein n=1 Tax=Arundo donax TaxID=35708 RepID=A0A0A9CEN9_ARUDO
MWGFFRMDLYLNLLSDAAAKVH